MHFVLTGPESTGKTSLAKTLSEHFAATLIPECARAYLEGLAGPYQPSDLLRIANLQQAAERDTAHPLIFGDTDLQVIYIWWQERIGPVPSSLLAAYARQSERHYLLCAPDTVWQPDPQRENPHDRERLFHLYEADLKARGLSYDVIDGLDENRVQCAIAAVEAKLDNIGLG